MLSRAQIDALIREYFDAALKDDEIFRVSDRPEPDWKSEDSPDRFFLEHLGETNEEIERSLQVSGKSAVDAIYESQVTGDEDEHRFSLAQNGWQDAAGFADELLAEKNVTLPHDSLEYRLLCLGILRARREALYVIQGRCEGDWSRLPRDPFFRSPIPISQFNASATVAPSQPPKPLGEAVEQYLKERSKSGDSAKWLVEQQTALRWFIDYFEKEKPVSSFTRPDIVEFKDGLGDLASKWTLKFKGVNIREAIKRSRAGTYPQNDREALNTKRLGPINQFFEWAKNNGYIDENPATNVRFKVARRKRKQEKRDSFKVDQLNAIFRAPVFTGAESKRNWKQPGSYQIRDGRYWVPLVALFTGGRRRELCQMLATDVFETQDIWVMSIDDIPDEDDTTPQKSLKNIESKRIIPVHPELERLGFLEYAVERAQTGQKLLFDCEAGVRGDYDPFGKWFGRFLDSLGISSPRLVFHSFRNTFERAMLANIDDWVARCQLGGRTRTDSASDYAYGHDLKRLYEEIKKVAYPGLNLAHLYAKK